MEKKRGRNNKNRKEDDLIFIVGCNIKKYRIEKGLTQEQLQEISGLTISRYETGKKDMVISTIGILSRCLNVDAYKFFLKNHKN